MQLWSDNLTAPTPPAQSTRPTPLNRVKNILFYILEHFKYYYLYITLVSLL